MKNPVRVWSLKIAQENKMTAEFLEKLDDLIIQATKERSHYYTKNVLLEAKAKIQKMVRVRELAAELFDPKKWGTVQWMDDPDMYLLADRFLEALEDTK